MDEINAAIANGPEMDLLGPFAADYVGFKVFQVWNTMFVPDLFVVIPLSRDPMRSKAWIHLQEAHIDSYKG